MAPRISELKILIRGGGEMASGIAHRLRSCHMDVMITEIAAPTAVRRTVAFAEAVYEGAQTIEGITARRAASVAEVQAVWRRGEIPVVVDADAAMRSKIKPNVLIDAIMAKRNCGTTIDDAALVIGVGPGFCAGVNVHAVVESNRGYHLGRVIWDGEAEPDTGVPAPVAGHAEDRVLRAPKDGIFNAQRAIGDVVDAGEIVGTVEGVPIRADIAGLIRGMLRDGVPVRAGMKAGDIDPRLERGYCYAISDKSRAIGGGVLEAILGASIDLKLPTD
jgi:xanthine dehydrogenase accessory factor